MDNAESQADGADSERLKALYGFVPRLFRVQASAPAAVRPQSLMLQALLGNESCLSRRQKEEILLAVSAARQSSYGIALHQQMLRLLGVGEAEVVRSAESPQGPLSAFARSLALEAAHADAPAVDELRRAGFTEPQIVEAILLAGMGVFLATMQFGTGAIPDFAPASPAPTNIPHPRAAEPRPIDETQDTTSEPDPDADVVRRVQTGDAEAFAILVERHGQRAYRALAALLGNPDEARDALQDTFLKAYRSMGAFEGRSRFSSWLMSIAHNTGLQRLRDRRIVESIDGAGEDEEYRPREVRAWDDNPEQLYSKAEIRAKVERAIGGLPAPYRVVLLMRDVEQVSTKDAADALGLSIPALKARLNRGRLMLREALSPHFTRGAKA